MKKISVMLAAVLMLLTACVQNPPANGQETTAEANVSETTVTETAADTTTVPVTTAPATTTLPETTTEAVTTMVTVTAAEPATATTAPTEKVTTTVPATPLDEDETPFVPITEESITTTEEEIVPPWWATGTRAPEYEGEPFMKMWLDKDIYPQDFDYITISHETTMDGPIHIDYTVEKWTGEKWDDTAHRYVLLGESYDLVPPKSSETLGSVNFYPPLTPGKYRVKAKLYTYMKAEDFIDDGSEYTVNEDGYRTNYYYLEFEITE